jgi:hypothetical protein
MPEFVLCILSEVIFIKAMDVFMMCLAQTISITSQYYNNTVQKYNNRLNSAKIQVTLLKPRRYLPPKASPNSQDLSRRL